MFENTNFFCVGDGPTEYLDVNKLMLFFALYDRSASKEERVKFMFRMLADEISNPNEELRISAQNKTAAAVIEILTTLSCKLTATYIKSVSSL